MIINRKKLAGLFIFILCVFSINAEPRLVDKPKLRDKSEKDDGASVADLIPQIIKVLAEDDDDDAETVLVIKSNVSKAEVFLNGNYMGNTPLEINSVRPGRYTLELRKKGYEREKRHIEVKKGRKTEYNISLEEILGYISFSGLVPGSDVVVDGVTFHNYGNNSSTNKVVSVAPGAYMVTVNRFGYETFSKSVTVFPYQITPVQVQMQEAEFSLENLEASRKVFNPNLKGSKGKVEFSFRVSADGKVNAFLCDSVGRQIRNYSFGNFKTWKQSFAWNGLDEYGDIVQDGIYYLTVESGSYSHTCSVQVNSLLKYPNVAINRSLGVGNVPLLDDTDTTYMAPYFGVCADFCNNNNEVTPYSSDIILGFAAHLSRFFELNLFGQVPFYCDYASDQYEAGLNIKLFNFSNAAQNLKIGYGALLKFAYTPNQKYYPFGVDSGNGAGGNLILSLLYNNLGLTYSVGLVLGASGGSFTTADRVLTNSLALSYAPADVVKINLFSSLDSAFGLYEKADGMPNAVRAGGNLCFMPEGYTFSISLNGQALFVLDEPITYYSFGLMLSYLF